MLNLQLSTTTLVLAGLALVAIWAFFRLWEIVVVIATAFIFMAALLPYVEWLVNRGVNRVGAVLILLAAFLVVAAAVIALVVPAMVEEGKDFNEELPEYGRQLDEQLDKLGFETDIEGRVSTIKWGEIVSGREAVDYGQRALVIIISLISIVVITCYLLVDAPRLSAFVYQFVSPGKEPEVQRFIDSLRTVVGGYVRGQFITSAVIAAFTSGVMFALGLPNAIAFGIFAAFADIIPLVGATLAIAPPVLIALDESVSKALIVLVALILYQQFEDRFLTPRVYGATLNLPPIIVLIAVLIGGELFGISGVLLALPATAIGRVILDYYLRQRSMKIGELTTAGDVFAPDLGPAASPTEGDSNG